MAHFLKSLYGRALGLSTRGSPMTGDALIGRSLAISKVGPSTAVSGVSTETAFDKKATIKAGTLDIGSLLMIRFQGIATATNSTDTLAVKLYIGGTSGTALISMAATDVANDNVFGGEYELKLRTIGASGTLVGVGTFKSVPAAEGTMTIKDDILPSTAIDTTVANDIVVSATWSTTNAGNSCRLDFLRVLQF